jgi:hypothetical protein
MKEFDEFRFNRLEERAWQLTLELEARGKTEAEDADAQKKPADAQKKPADAADAEEQQ